MRACIEKKCICCHGINCVTIVAVAVFVAGFSEERSNFGGVIDRNEDAYDTLLLFEAVRAGEQEDDDVVDADAVPFLIADDNEDDDMLLVVELLCFG